MPFKTNCRAAAYEGGLHLVWPLPFNRFGMGDSSGSQALVITALEVTDTCKFSHHAKVIVQESVLTDDGRSKKDIRIRIGMTIGVLSIKWDCLYLVEWASNRKND